MLNPANFKKIYNQNYNNIRLESGTYMALRSKPFILRIHSSKKKEYMEGIYSELLLYFPWNSEKELNGNKVEECLELFNQNNEIIKKNKNAIFPKAHMPKSK